MPDGKLRKEKAMEEIEPMRTAAFAFAAVGVLISGPSHAACTKPDIPACAVQKGAFPSGADFDPPMPLLHRLMPVMRSAARS
jgi:hypothetical protein